MRKKRRFGDGKNSEYGKKSLFTGSLGESFPPRSGRVRLLAAAVLLTAAVCAVLVVISVYSVDNITVEGNHHYSEEEIVDMVIRNQWDNNSLILSLKYRDREIEGIPFVEKMEVDILSTDSVRITVYEKALAGYIEYLGQYVYFDKDGIVVESSHVRTVGIPEITGLEFSHVVLYEPLPVAHAEVFGTILDMTQLLTKYEISADRIYFDKNYEMTLYFEDIRVKLGDTGGIDQKISRLKAILPELEGQKGVLRMQNYDDTTKNITFERDE
ncbi:MAG: cell division protein FtsQ/DivIB [Lachnospiraceae bacterium]|nr:cell division protein FtsQ/DivIB [Lachnospiraceae bacterium]